MGKNKRFLNSEIPSTLRHTSPTSYHTTHLSPLFSPPLLSISSILISSSPLPFPDLSPYPTQLAYCFYPPLLTTTLSLWSLPNALSVSLYPFPFPLSGSFYPCSTTPLSPPTLPLFFLGSSLVVPELVRKLGLSC